MNSRRTAINLMCNSGRLRSYQQAFILSPRLETSGSSTVKSNCTKHATILYTAVMISLTLLFNEVMKSSFYFQSSDFTRSILWVSYEHSLTRRQPNLAA